MRPDRRTKRDQGKGGKDKALKKGTIKSYIAGKERGRETRPDTRLPKSRAGGQGPYLRSPDHVGRSSEVKEIKS